MDYSPLFAPETTVAIQAHAIACYPNEACGVVTPAGFVPLENVHATPQKAFDCDAAVEPFFQDGSLLAIVHSHPSHRSRRVAPIYPSAADMTQQVAFDIPWGICATEGTSCTVPWFWGGELPRPPLEGRKFRHGPSGSDGRGDCYALIRDFYLQEMGQDIPEFPRDWEWWQTDRVEDGDLYEQGFGQAGFRNVPRTDVRYGDVGLVIQPCTDAGGCALQARAIHGVVYVGNEKVLHHRFGRLSVIEPLREWNLLVKRWVRHSSTPD